MPQREEIHLNCHFPTFHNNSTFSINRKPNLSPPRLSYFNDHSVIAKNSWWVSPEAGYTRREWPCLLLSFGKLPKNKQKKDCLNFLLLRVLFLDLRYEDDDRPQIACNTLQEYCQRAKRTWFSAIFCRRIPMLPMNYARFSGHCTHYLDVQLSNVTLELLYFHQIHSKLLRFPRFYAIATSHAKLCTEAHRRFLWSVTRDWIWVLLCFEHCFSALPITKTRRK